MRRLTSTITAILALAVAHAGAPRQAAHRAPRLWTDEALASWALPIAGVNATPTFYKESEYYAAPVSELRTCPVYVKDKEPAGYRDEILNTRHSRPSVRVESVRRRQTGAASIPENTVREEGHVRN